GDNDTIRLAAWRAGRGGSVRAPSTRRPQGSPSGLHSLARAAAFAAGVVLPFEPPAPWPAILAPVAALGVLPALRRPRCLLWPVLLGAVLGLTNRLSDPVPALLGAWQEHGFSAG